MFKLISEKRRWSKCVIGVNWKYTGKYQQDIGRLFFSSVCCYRIGNNVSYNKRCSTYPNITVNNGHKLNHISYKRKKYESSWKIACPQKTLLSGGWVIIANKGGGKKKYELTYTA